MFALILLADERVNATAEQDKTLSTDNRVEKHCDGNLVVEVLARVLLGCWWAVWSTLVAC